MQCSTFYKCRLTETKGQSKQRYLFLSHALSQILLCFLNLTFLSLLHKPRPSPSLTHLLIFRHAHDVHCFGGVTKLLCIVDTCNRQIPVGKELVSLCRLVEKFLLLLLLHSIENLVEDVERPLIGCLTNSPWFLSEIWAGLCQGHTHTHTHSGGCYNWGTVL